ncbi:hypothetical protein KVF89_22455 [Nocardioides carbamazepini]|uniref:hypothetical protein n=1 Tax=Nocardioides carbamazepini TaxID=2854259 RepID=UPI00214A612F|nr:hypothetical protein [Nocardioides carbamazepini]MCR1785319.1 hypothetical protein [Nocardioides carbamazepini]
MTTTAKTSDPIVKVARDLTEIEHCHDELRAQAIAAGDDPNMPGGAAMVALGPVADIEAWNHLSAAAEDYGRPYVSLDDEEDDEQRWPPQQLIGYWAGELRRLRGEDYAGLVRTFASDLNYVRGSLAWAAEHDTARWPRFAGDVRRARLTIENIVSAGRRADRSRIVCDRDHCEKTPQPRLVRVYSPRYVVGWTCATCSTHTPAEYRCEDRNHPAPASAQPCTRMVGPRKDRHLCGSRTRVVTPEPTVCLNVRCRSFTAPVEVLASDPARDGWKCPSCKHRYTDTELQRAHAKMLWRPEADRLVRLQEAVATLKSQGRGERTIRRWLAPRLELVDRCTECAAIHDHREHPACPVLLPPEEDGGEPVVCGGELAERWHGDAEAVVEGWCDIATHTTWLWWPDLWRLHLTTRTTPRERGMMAS